MSKQTKALSREISQLVDDARALVTATADVASDKVAEARQRLADSLERGRELYGRARESAVEGVRATDLAVREHPYEAIAISVGVGALLGYIAGCRCTRNGN